MIDRSSQMLNLVNKLNKTVGESMSGGIKKVQIKIEQPQKATNPPPKKKCGGCSRKKK